MTVRLSKHDQANASIAFWFVGRLGSACRLQTRTELGKPSPARTAGRIGPIWRAPVALPRATQPPIAPCALRNFTPETDQAYRLRWST
jgi:hypothetical protein